MAENSESWITQEAFDRLQTELDELIANRRIIATEINERREEGDLKENGGYHAAREIQGQQEARIRYLQNFLSTVKVGTAPTSADTVVPGTVITVEYEGDPDDTEAFLFANREQMDKDSDLDVYSPSSPIGTAIIDSKKGETISYTSPTGDEITLKITKIEPYIP